MRVIVHTGKGGVGKTSISAATALRCSEMGQFGRCARPDGGSRTDRNRA